MKGICWIDGELMPAENARISVYDHGLLYGDGVFEGMRFYHKQVFRLQEHFQRLHRSAQAVGIRLPFSDKALQQAIEQAMDQYCSERRAQEGYIRLIVTRGVGNLGLNPKHCATPSVIILVDELEIMDEQQRLNGIRLTVSSLRRQSPHSLDSRIKSLNYLTAVLAKQEANQAQADEAIILNERGHIAECSAENLFIVSDGMLLTPPVIDGALAGITRQTIIELAAQLKLPCQERSLGVYDIVNAQECFLTGSGARLIPVRQLDGCELAHCPGPIFKALQQAYLDLIETTTRPKAPVTRFLARMPLL